MIMASLKIASMNVRGLRDAEKRSDLFDWLRNKNFSLYLLQESHSTKDIEHTWESEWGFKILFSHGTSNSRGACILINNNFSYTLERCIVDDDGRYVIVALNVDGKNIIICNIYGPNKDQPTFFQNLFNALGSLPDYPMIIGGDFNVVQDTSLDKQGGRAETNKRAQAELKTNIENLDLIDIWRVRNPSLRRYTWRQKHPLIQCRLDYFILSQSIANEVQNVQISPGYRTDHNLITINIPIHNHKRGPGHWKLNSSLVVDPVYQQKIKNIIAEQITEHSTAINPAALWEFIKMKIRQETIKYSSDIKKKRSTLLQELETKLAHLQVKANETPNPDILEQIDKIEDDIREIRKHRVRGIMIRAKARWIGEGEQNSSFFANLEKRNFENKIIKEIHTDNKVITEPKEILEEEKSFYDKLYSDTAVDNEVGQHLNNLFFPENPDIPKLNEDAKEQCEDDIALEDLQLAVKSMKNGKSPGNDGLTAEFYKIFWSEVKHLLLASFNWSFNNGLMTVSQRQGILTLLPKKEKDTRYLKNWRPISLLNVDYKILSTCIANKLKPHLPTLISNDQTGFCKGRYIGENIRTTLDIIQYLEKHHQPGILLALDFAKAFDTLKWDFIFNTLKYLNFGDKYIKWVKLLYSDISSTIINNGWSSGYFALHRGVRQGCPASPYLFILCAEILAHSIRSDKQIKGIKIATKEIKVIQYADDTSSFLDGTESSLNAILSLLLKFGTISGLKVNFEKSKAAKVGSLYNSVNNPRSIRRLEWVSTSINILGITIPLKTNIQQLVQLNFTPKMNEIEKLLEVWKKRSLTLFGKICVIKMLAIPKLVYQLTILPSPSQSWLEQIETNFKLFIWDGKKAKINMRQLYQNYEDGGLKLTSIKEFCQSLRISWVKKITTSDDYSTIGVLTKEFLGKHHNKLIWKGNLHFKDVHKLKIQNAFLNDVLIAWCKVHYVRIEDLDDDNERKMQMLWYNSNIKINNGPVYYKAWYDKNIVFINDLLQDSGRVHSCEYFRDTLHIKTHFLEYGGLIAAVHWRFDSAITDTMHFPDIVEARFEQMTLSGSRFFYWKILEKTEFKCKWLDDFEIDDSFCHDIFRTIYTCTVDTKLQNFQYKLLHRILPTKSLLFKMKVKDNELCNFCLQCKDSLAHVYYECEVSQAFWIDVFNLINSVIETEHVINGSQETVILGYLGSETWAVIVNFIILFAKYLLHCCYWTDKKPRFGNMISKLKYYRSIELEIALTKHKILEVLEEVL
jgi:exonuclease III